MRSILRYGGVAASILLIVFGIGTIIVGIDGRNEVGDNLAQEGIVGTPDMTPELIAKEAKAAGLRGVSLPTCSVAGESIDTGSRAKCFASYMRVHALEATGGETYSQMPRYQTADGKGTNDVAGAVKGDDGTPLDNPARTVWVTETALSTALNTSYFAQSVALFAIVMGIALVLAGIGFLLLTTGLLAGRSPATSSGAGTPRAVEGGQRTVDGAPPPTPAAH